MYKRGFVSIVIVDWRSNDLLKKCIFSISIQIYRDFEIILVENEPEDNSLGEIKNFFSQIKIIINRKNIFYSSAQNQGIREAKGEFILSLNNDVILDKNFLEEAVKSMCMDERIGIVSGKILSYKGDFIDSTGQFLGRSRKPIERGFRKKDLGQFDKPGFIFGVCGACAFYRRKMLEEIKLGDGEYFDDDYGLFYEDLDLNWRANRFGWRGYYNPKAIAYHLRGSSSKLNEPKFKIFKHFQFCALSSEHKLMLLRNRYATIIKNEALNSFLRNFFFIFFYDLSVWFYIILFNPSLILKLGKEIKFLYNAFIKRKEVRLKCTGF